MSGLGLNLRPTFALSYDQNKHYYKGIEYLVINNNTF